MLSKCRRKSADLIEPLFMPHHLPQGSHISACGHVMHADCWRRFVFSSEPVNDLKATIWLFQNQYYVTVSFYCNGIHVLASMWKILWRCNN